MKIFTITSQGHHEGASIGFFYFKDGRSVPAILMGTRSKGGSLGLLPIKLRGVTYNNWREEVKRTRQALRYGRNSSSCDRYGDTRMRISEAKMIISTRSGGYKLVEANGKPDVDDRLIVILRNEWDFYSGLPYEWQCRECMNSEKFVEGKVPKKCPHCSSDFSLSMRLKCCPVPGTVLREGLGFNGKEMAMAIAEGEQFVTGHEPNTLRIMKYREEKLVQREVKVRWHRVFVHGVRISK